MQGKTRSRPNNQEMFLFRGSRPSEGTQDNDGDPLDTSRHHIRKDLVVNSSRNSTSRSTRKLMLRHAKRGLLSKDSRRRLSKSLSGSGNEEDMQDLAKTWEDKLDDAKERLESDMLRAPTGISNSGGDDPMAKSSDGSACVDEDKVEIVNNARGGTMNKRAMDKMLAYRMAGNSGREISGKAECDKSVTAADAVRHTHRHTTIASSWDSGRAHSDGRWTHRSSGTCPSLWIFRDVSCLHSLISCVLSV